MSCTSCQDNCYESSQECECQIKDFSTDCILYSGPDLTCSGITSGKILTDLIVELDEATCNKFSEATNYLNITNVGGGFELYKGISFIGNKEFKTLIGGDYLEIIDSGEDLTINNYKASEEQVGSIEIATQSEVNLRSDEERAITPSTLQQGVETVIQDSSIIDQHVITTVVDSPIVEQYIQNISETIAGDSSNLPIATETVSGITEIATQTEVTNGVDTFRYVTPATLQQGVENIIENSTIVEQYLETVIETNPAILQQLSNVVPSGIITMWSGSINTIPVDWYLCNGQTVNTLITPNLSGRFIVGYDPNDINYEAVGDTGGEISTTLTEDNLPAHVHGISGLVDNRSSGSGFNINQVAPGAFTGTSQTETSSAGEINPTPINNLPPFYTIAYIIYLP